VAESVSILVDEKEGLILPEQDMPGGLTFAHAFGTAPVPKICFIRVAVIPILSLVMLLSLLPQGRAIFSLTIGAFEQPIVPGLILVAQFFWLFRNNRHFLFGDGLLPSDP
jgi:hypothetical protein